MIEWRQKAEDRITIRDVACYLNGLALGLAIGFVAVSVVLAFSN